MRLTYWPHILWTLNSVKSELSMAASTMLCCPHLICILWTHSCNTCRCSISGTVLALYSSQETMLDIRQKRKEKKEKKKEKTFHVLGGIMMLMMMIMVMMIVNFWRVLQTAMGKPCSWCILGQSLCQVINKDTYTDTHCDSHTHTHTHTQERKGGKLQKESALKRGMVSHHVGLKPRWSLITGGLSGWSHQGGLKPGWSLKRVVSNQGWFLTRVVSYQGWSLTRVVSNQGGLSRGWSQSKGGLSPGWSLPGVVS